MKYQLKKIFYMEVVVVKNGKSKKIDYIDLKIIQIDLRFPIAFFSFSILLFVNISSLLNTLYC